MVAPVWIRTRRPLGYEPSEMPLLHGARFDVLCILAQSHLVCQALPASFPVGSARHRFSGSDCLVNMRKWTPHPLRVECDSLRSILPRHYDLVKQLTARSVLL